MQEFILRNLITIIFLGLFIYGFMKGYATGFIKTILSFGSIIVSILLTRMFTPSVASVVKDVTNIESTLTSMIYNSLINTHLYDSLSIPFIKDAIGTGNIEMTIKEGLCANLANAIINLLCGIAVFVITMILIKIVIRILDIIDLIPVVGQLNKLLGGVFGILEILVITWIGFAILRVFEGVPNIQTITDNIKQSFLVGSIYNNNFIYEFFANLFTATV